MRYSDMVNLIRKSTELELVEDLLVMRNNDICFRSTGTTRTCYVFDTFVVKVHNYHRSETNKREFNNYCKYITQQNTLYPVVRSRLYQTTDSKYVLIQERVADILDDCSDEFRRDADYNNLPEEVGHLVNSELVDFDGFQMGRNKRGKYVFFDFPIDMDA